jgi:hypothetical protein
VAECFLHLPSYRCLMSMMSVYRVDDNILKIRSTGRKNMADTQNIQVVIPLPEKKRKFVQAGCICMMLSVAMYGLVFATLTSPILESVNAMGYVGLFSIFSALGLSIMTPIGGKLGDLIGRRNIVVIPGIICAVCGIAFAFVRSLVLLMILRFLISLAQGAFTAAPYIITGLINERKKVASDFEKKVKNELSFLDMPKMQFFVNFDKGNLSSTGFDKIEFMISANPGEPPKSLSKVASGGELSRIMLAIKSIISYNDTIGTLIFDEIDTGVSGRASQKIGLKLKSVSKNTQVICVTHSAQIASNANEHFLIQKKFDDNKTFTSVTPLDFEGRKSELARIMGGLEITDTLLQSAEELLNQNLYGN